MSHMAFGKLPGFDEDPLDMAIICLNAVLIAGVFIQSWQHSGAGRVMIFCAGYTIFLRCLAWYKRRQYREEWERFRTLLSAPKNPAPPPPPQAAQTFTLKTEYNTDSQAEKDSAPRT